MSAFGGIVAFHGTCDGPAAASMGEVFTEVVIAPAFDDDALAAFAARPNLRVLRAPVAPRPGLDVRTLPGGALVQDPDPVGASRDGWTVVSRREPTAAEWADLELAWTVAWRVKSNTITLVREGATVGDRRRSDVTRGRGMDRRPQGRRPGRRRGRRLRRVLPVPRRPRGRG